MCLSLNKMKLGYTISSRVAAVRLDSEKVDQQKQKGPSTHIQRTKWKSTTFSLLTKLHAYHWDGINQVSKLSINQQKHTIRLSSLVSECISMEECHWCNLPDYLATHYLYLRHFVAYLNPLLLGELFAMSSSFFFYIKIVRRSPLSSMFTFSMLSNLYPSLYGATHCIPDTIDCCPQKFATINLCL